MEFTERIIEFSKNIPDLNCIANEAETRSALIEPFFTVLGYDVHDVNEVRMEYAVEESRNQKAPRVDMAVMSGIDIRMFVECKSCHEILKNHETQLFEYMRAAGAIYGVLTNGLVYHFYSVSATENPELLLVFNVQNASVYSIEMLKKFAKDTFDPNSLVLQKSVEKAVREEIENPSNEFIRLLIGRVYDGKKNAQIIQLIEPMIRNSLQQYSRKDDE